MKKRTILTVFSFVIMIFFSLGITQSISNAATSGGGAHPTFKSPMVNYKPSFVSNPEKLYTITYEYNVSGISNAKE